MKYISLIWFCFLSIQINAQDIQYQLGSSSAVQFNPAFCGDAFHRNTNYNRLMLGHRNGNYLNGSHSFFTYDAYHWNLGGSIGLIAQQSSPGQGLLNLRSLSGLFAYIMPVSKQVVLKYGIQAGVESKQTDHYTSFRMLEFPLRMEGLDPIYRRELESLHHLMEQKNYFTLGFGSIIETKALDAGFALHNINRPDWSLIENVSARKAVLLNLHAVYRFYTHKNYRLSAKAAFSHQGLENQIQSGVQFKNRKFMVGVFYRSNIAYRAATNYLSASVGYNIDHFQLILGSEYRLNSMAWSTLFYQSISLQYLFHSSGVRVCRPVFRNQFPDETF